MMLAMIECGLKVQAHHHEVASGGQGEIDMRYAPLVEMADSVLKYKYIVKNVARKNGKTATFMPKPIFLDNGSGMHVHTSLWQTAKTYSPAPVTPAYPKRPCTPSAACSGTRPPCALSPTRPPTATSVWCPATKRRSTSRTAAQPFRRRPHPRLFAASQGQTPGIPVARRLKQSLPRLCRHPHGHARRHQKQDGPGDPLDKDIYDLEPEELAKVPKTPSSLEEALNCLDKDQEFLLHGDVFTEDVISTWIWYKREKEVEAVRLRPHPFEFALYYDI